MILQINKDTKDIFESPILQENCVELLGKDKENYLLQKAKEAKIAELNNFIFIQKTKPFEKFTAPEILPNGTIGASVSFRWYIDAIPNSKLTPESILSKCVLDSISCVVDVLKDDLVKDYATFKSNALKAISNKVVPYPTIIIKDGKEYQGAVNISPIYSLIANHIQTREIVQNTIKNNLTDKINKCSSVEEVEAIKFE